MLSFAYIIKKIHLNNICIEPVSSTATVLKEHMRFGAQKRARLETPPQKMAHLLIESLFVDTISISNNLSVPTLLDWCRKKHNVFAAKCFTIDDKNSNTRDIFEQMFCRIQRTYFAFSRLARLWRLRKAPVQINHDMFMTPINPRHKHTFLLLQQNNIYYFSARDLCKILTNSITNSCMLFSEPQIVRNPYNNVMFNKADLYNMYWKIRESVCIVPTIIELWFKYGFDIYHLRKCHEHEFADYAIDNYIHQLNVMQKCYEIYDMLYDLKFEELIQPNPEFNLNATKQFVSDMTPFLRLFLKVDYYPDKIVAANLKRELICKLRWFSNVYPNYGRNVKIVNVKSIQPENTSIFMTSHMYSEAKYSTYIKWGKYDNGDNGEEAQNREQDDMLSEMSETVEDDESDVSQGDYYEEEEDFDP